MLIHCSEQLSRKLPCISQSRPAETSPVGSWHCNIYAVEQHDCLLFCHDLTRYVVFIPGLKSDDFHHLDTLFKSPFIQSLTDLGLDAAVTKKVSLTIGKVEFDCYPEHSALDHLDQISARVVDRVREVENFMMVYPPAITHNMTHYPVNLPNEDGVCPEEEAMRSRIMDIVR